MRQLFKRLQIGTLMISGFVLVIFGAAGYATFAEANHVCQRDDRTSQYIAGTFIPENKR